MGLLNECTVISYTDEGYPDSDIPPRVYAGALTTDHVLQLTHQEVYPRQAIVTETNDAGEAIRYLVTFSIHAEPIEGSGPELLNEPNVKGEQFGVDHAGCGHAAYDVAIVWLRYLANDLKPKQLELDSPAATTMAEAIRDYLDSPWA